MSQKRHEKEIAQLQRTLPNPRPTFTDISAKGVTVTVGGFEFRIEIPESYPYQQPTIRVVEPYEYTIPTDNWGPSKLFYSYISDFLANQPLYLVLGGYPVNESRGRSFYELPFVYILDTVDAKDTDVFRDRYIQCDFTKIDALRSVANMHQGRFTTIFFDWSTYNFFEEHNKKDRLELLLKLLTPEGTLVIEEPEGRGLGYESNITKNLEIMQQKKNNLKELCTILTSLGYHATLTNSKKVTDSIIKEAFTRNTGETILLALVTKEKNIPDDLCTKTDEKLKQTLRNLENTRGGGRRKQTRKRSRKSKGTRRH